MTEMILTCNAGSNSLKCGLYLLHGLRRLYSFESDRIHDAPTITISDDSGKRLVRDTIDQSGYEASLSFFLDWQNKYRADGKTVLASHRIVHGGKDFQKPAAISQDVYSRLERLIPLAPLHQPHNLALVDILRKKYPELFQVACFDTAFHQTQPDKAQMFALPRDIMEKDDIYRYGFHGLSYAYIAGILPESLEDWQNKKVIIAHLGSGASMCALRGGKSIDTTMGFTALDGLMMGTRCGSLDPGVVLYLLKEKGMDASQIEDMLYKKSGLLGVSGVSSDMRDLSANESQAAQQAIRLFCYRAARQMGGLVAALGGLDALIFTGGMGRNDGDVRAEIATYFKWMGLALDNKANSENKEIISADASSVRVFALPTDEESVLARQAEEVYHNSVKEYVHGEDYAATPRKQAISENREEPFGKINK